jgi:hypothetical protein
MKTTMRNHSIPRAFSDPGSLLQRNEIGNGHAWSFLNNLSLRSMVGAVFFSRGHRVGGERKHSIDFSGEGLLSAGSTLFDPLEFGRLSIFKGIGFPPPQIFLTIVRSLSPFASEVRFHCIRDKSW